MGVTLKWYPHAVVYLLVVMLFFPSTNAWSCNFTKEEMPTFPEMIELAKELLRNSTEEGDSININDILSMSLETADQLYCSSAETGVDYRVDAEDEEGDGLFRPVLWPDGVVRYSFSRIGWQAPKMLKTHMAAISNVTCITFEPVEEDDFKGGYLDVMDIYDIPENETFNEHFYFPPGYAGKRQVIFQDTTDTMKKGNIGLLLRALGLSSEHRRQDRERHIKIVKTTNWRKRKLLFAKENPTYLHTIFPYDMNSSTHIAPGASKKLGVRIAPVNESLTMKPSLKQLSEIDIEKLNYLYCTPNRTLHEDEIYSESTQETLTTATTAPLAGATSLTSSKTTATNNSPASPITGAMANTTDGHSYTAPPVSLINGKVEPGDIPTTMFTASVITSSATNTTEATAESLNSTLLGVSNVTTEFPTTTQSGASPVTSSNSTTNTTQHGMTSPASNVSVTTEPVNELPFLTAESSSTTIKSSFTFTTVLLLCAFHSN